MYDSSYIMYLSPDGLPSKDGPSLLSYRVMASTFLPVEDLGHKLAKDLSNANPGEEWTLRSIEKIYSYSQGEFDMYGPIDFSLVGDKFVTFQTADVMMLRAMLGFEAGQGLAINA